MEDHERKTRLLRSRASLKGVATRYTKKAAELLAVPTAQLTVAQRNELFGFKAALESKRSLIADLGKEIEMLIEDDDTSEAEVAESSENLDAITQTILPITRLLTKQINQWLSSIRLRRQCKMRDDKYVKDLNYQK